MAAPLLGTIRTGARIVPRSGKVNKVNGHDPVWRGAGGDRGWPAAVASGSPPNGVVAIDLVDFAASRDNAGTGPDRSQEWRGHARPPFAPLVRRPVRRRHRSRREPALAGAPRPGPRPGPGHLRR